MEKEGMIYPWDNLKIIAQPNAPTVEIGEAQGYIDNELLKTSFIISPQTKGADIMCGLGLIPEADEAMQVRISNKHNLPSKYTTLSMTVNSLENNSSVSFAVTGAEGSGSDKPNSSKKNALALLGMQSIYGNIGSAGETAGRLWEIMTSHPTPSIFVMQIKKGVESLFNFVQTGEYDLLPQRLLDVFELWLEMFPSDSIFAKKLDALVYMNRK
ncbi:MAG: hypothetical protein PHE51_05765, partial [Eubacteriales bacterium]|nr:hypothetical protein [Eubacteriales bacterium]